MLEKDLEYPPDIILPEMWDNYIEEIGELESINTWSGSRESYIELLSELELKFKEYQKKLFLNAQNDTIRFEFETNQFCSDIQFLVIPPKREFRCRVPLNIESKITKIESLYLYFLNYFYLK